jgi:hypothetical protein
MEVRDNIRPAADARVVGKGYLKCFGPTDFTRYC